LAVILLTTSLSVIAQTRHPISKIEFHSRIPTSILLTQSALSENRTYTDADLDLAAARLRRLPFVYYVNYTIDGTTAIFEIADEYRGFFHVDTLARQSTGGPGDNGFLSGELGGRYYLPWGGTAQATYGASSVIGSSAYTFQYSQYGLARTRLYFIVDASRPRSGGTQPHYEIGYPLTLRQSITLTGSRRQSSDSESSGINNHFTSDSVQHDMELAWQWNTTNDPLFATRGAAFLVGRGRTKEENHALSVSGTRVIFSNDSKTDSDYWHAGVGKFWPVGRGAFTANADAKWFDETRHSRSRSTDPFAVTGQNERTTSATAGWVHDFFKSVSELTASRRRVELAIGIQTYDFKARGITTRQNFKNMQAGYAFRNRWGNVHFVLSYLERY